jgi:hypothetical protein
VTTAEVERSRRIAWVGLGDVVESDRNAKSHDLPRLVDSIRAFGFTAPLIVDERTGKLVAGHGRLAALRKLRADQDEAPDGITVADGEWQVPVVAGWSSRDDDHAKAVAVADNRLSEVGGWDDRALAEILEEIGDVDPDLLNVTGWSANDVDRLLASVVGDRDKPPGEFPSYDEDIETQYSCPKCGYDWSGKPG